jgi:hypothetical protein
VNTYFHSSTVFGPRRERKKIYLVTRPAQLAPDLFLEFEGDVTDGTFTTKQLEAIARYEMGIDYGMSPVFVTAF